MQLSCVLLRLWRRLLRRDLKGIRTARNLHQWDQMEIHANLKFITDYTTAIFSINPHLANFSPSRLHQILLRMSNNFNIQNHNINTYPTTLGTLRNKKVAQETVALQKNNSIGEKWTTCNKNNSEQTPLQKNDTGNFKN